VADDPADERKAHSNTFGTYTGPNKIYGLACNDGGKFAIFLDRRALCHELIAHEIFHTTHKIMEYVGDSFTNRNPEPHAYLNGWITSHVYALCSAWRLKIKRKL
jgi:hypothetical protein